jgi:hypothetical protein
LKDDLNDFIPIVPESFTADNEMISILQPADIMDWKEKNPGKFDRMRRQLEWLNNYSESSNPVVVVGKCK